jgi:uncharacterized protein
VDDDLEPTKPSRPLAEEPGLGGDATTQFHVWLAHRRHDLAQDERGERELRHEDVIVVAPYNAQVRCLREKLPIEIAVGTVDKFQGQQAPVVFYAMGSSSSDDVPRGLDFLFSRNRLNVAISRAQCLAYLVCSPRLLDANCQTVEQMRLANALCRLVEVA